MNSDRLSQLEALRDLLWESIQDVDPEKRATLAAQYRATISEIAGISKKSETVVSPIDEIRARRSARGGATSRLGEAKRSAS
jgi:hypothetical protein